MNTYEWLHQISRSEVPEHLISKWDTYHSYSLRGPNISDLEFKEQQWVRVYVWNSNKWLVGQIQEVLTPKRIKVMDKLIDPSQIPVVVMKSIPSISCLAPGYQQLIGVPIGRGSTELIFNRRGVMGDGSCLLHAWIELSGDTRPVETLRLEMAHNWNRCLVTMIEAGQWNLIWDHIQWVLVEPDMIHHTQVTVNGWLSTNLTNDWASRAQIRLGKSHPLVVAGWPNKNVVCKLEDWQNMMAILWLDVEWHPILAKHCAIPAEVLNICQKVGRYKLESIGYQLRPHVLVWLSPRYNLLVINIQTGKLESTGLDWIAGQPVMIMGWIDQCHYEPLLSENNQKLWLTSDPLIGLIRDNL